MPVMTNFFANFRKKSKQPKVETNEAMGEDVKAAPPAYISGSNTMSQPAATVPTPEVVPEVIADKIMEAAENADVEGADFGVVRGHAFNDLETAIALSAANIPVRPIAEQRPTEILKQAKNTNARGASFVIVGGNRYGQPKTHLNTNPVASQEANRVEPEPSLR